MKCKICGKETSRIGRHCNGHNLTSKEYYDLYIKNDDEGKCLHCKEETRYLRHKQWL